MRRIVISVVVLMFLVAGLVHAQFEPVPPTIQHYVIMVDDATLDGEQLSIGDQIGIFDGDLCVGASTVSGVWPLVLVAWEQDLGQFLEGYAPGNPILFQFWDAEQELIIPDVNAEFVQGDGTFGDVPLSEVSLTAVSPPSHDIEVDVFELDFGQVEIGSFNILTFSISNVGGTDLTIASATIVGDNDFRIPLYENVVLLPEEFDEIEVTFEPTLEQVYNAQIEIVSDDPDEALVTIDLMGEGFVDRHFTAVDPTNIVYPITVNEASINGVEIQAGDAIGVFDANTCVGVYLAEEPVAWPIVIDTYGMEGENPGFTDGNMIGYQIFESATDRVLLARANYLLGDGTFGDGAGATVELEAHDAIVEFFNSVTIQSQVFSNIHNRFFRDFGNVAALDEFATDGYDADLDAPEPGAPANLFISTYFPHPEWGAQFGDNFMVDVRDVEDDLTNAVKTFTFEVDTDLLGEMADLTFLIGDEYGNDFPDTLGVVLFDHETETYQNLWEIDFYNFVTTADERVFDLRLGDNTPPEIAITFPEEGDTLAANMDHLITWTLNDITSIRNVKVSYSLNDGNTWTLIDILNGTDNGPVELNWTAPDEYSLTAKIMVEAVDWAGNYSSEVTDFNFVIAPFAMINNFASNWHLASLPLLVDLTDIEDIIGDDIIGPYYVYDYDTDDGYNRTWEIEHGRGYWLALAEETLVGIQGIPVLDSSLYALDELWNIVGTALPTDVERNDLWFTDGDDSYEFVDAVNNGWLSPMLYGYNNETGSYFFADTMVPWGGYWIQTLIENIQMITYPPALDAGVLEIEDDNNGNRRNELDDELSWRLPIIAIQGEREDRLAEIGADTAATDEYDIWHDVPAPPAPQGRYVRILFNHVEWQTTAGSTFSRDIRANMGDSTTVVWNMSVVATNPGEVEITFDGIQDVIFSIPDYECWALVGEEERFVNLRYTDELTINHPGGEDEYLVKVIVSNYQFFGVDDNNINNLPLEFAVSSAYPNPFNPSTQVMVAVPEATRIQARVFDVLGREIEILDPGFVKAGYHQISWNSEESSGIYFLQISTSDGNVSTQKLVLMK